jgi:hypothetical protein
MNRKKKNYPHSFGTRSAEGTRKYATTCSALSTDKFRIGLNFRFRIAPCFVSMQSFYAQPLALKRAQVVSPQASSHQPCDSRNDQDRAHRDQRASSNPVHERGLVNSHKTLRRSASSSIGIFVPIVLLRRGIALCPNQASRLRLCQEERFEQLFKETSGPNNYRNSVRFAWSYGRTKNPMSYCRRSSDAPSARRNSGSRATVTRRLVQYCSSSIKFAGAAARNERRAA